MLRAFLIVWTLVAGLAAAGLLYIVGWRPQTSPVAMSSPPPSAASASRSTPTAAESPPAAVAAKPDQAGKAKSAVAEATPPVSTGSVGPAPENAPKVIARAETKPEQPSATAEPAAKLGVAGKSAERSAEPATSNPPAVAPAPAKTAPIPAPARTTAIAPKAAPVLPPDEETPPDELGTLPRAAAPSAEPGVTAGPHGAPRSEPKPAAVASTPATPPLRTVAPEPNPDKAKAAPRPAPKVAVRSFPPPVAEEKPAPVKPEAAKHETAKAEVQETSREASANRALTQRARVAARRSPRAVARQDDNDDAPASAVRDRAPVRAATAAQPRRPVRMARAARAVRAQGGSLEALLDDFSRSGSDFMHERTFRLGRGYLIERTTPNGTRYFYDRSASAY